MATLAPCAVGLSEQQGSRIHSLDWLRILAILGVFLFHAVHPFDLTPWHIKNAEQSRVVTFFIAFMFPWGMPFFFLLSGAGSFLALRRRTAGEFARERFSRLLLPFVVGAAFLMPPMLWFEWLHKTGTGVLQSSFREFVLDRNVGFTPIWFGALGYHLWFLGFLFSFSILSLPVFRWLEGRAGRRVLARVADLSGWRGGILLLSAFPAAVRLALQPFFPEEHSWADFTVQLSFFVLGFVLYAEPRFLQAVRRDWPIHLGSGLAATGAAMAIALSGGSLDVQAAPRSALDVLFWLLISLDGWCWGLFLLFLGMRFLEGTSRYLRYGQEAILPFFVFHQPVIIVLAYFAVRWEAALVVKLLFVVLGSFCVTVGLFEGLVRRIGVLRLAFGVKRAS